MSELGSMHTTEDIQIVVEPTFLPQESRPADSFWVFTYEVVVTNLGAAYPLIRFATGDLSALMPGTSPCGRTNQRIKGWMGRADQTAKVRGMFVHPSQISKMMKRHPEIERARLVVDWIDEADQISLKCECQGTNEGLSSAIAESFRAIGKLRAEVELVAPGSLPNDGKVIDDIRQYE